MKILVVGAKGMLGTDLTQLLKSTPNEILAWDKEEIDITKNEEMQKIILEKPEVVINCAAYTNVDLAEQEKGLCRAINVTGVSNLVFACKKINCIFVHISTDYVFGGEKESYDEEDEKHPLNYYGETKAEAEDIVKKELNKYYLIRTSWLFGRHGKNFVETIKKLSKEKKELIVVDDQTGRPTYTKDLSAAILKILEQKKEFGTYNITNSGKCSWFLFAKKIIELDGLDNTVKPCATKDFLRPAIRPKSSVLNNNKFDKLRNWESALKEYLSEV